MSRGRALRTLAVGVVLAAGSACLGTGTPAELADGSPTAAATTRVEEPLPRPSPSPATSPPAATTSAAPAVPAPWRAGPDEVLPEAKELATGIVEALTNYDRGAADEAPGSAVGDGSGGDELAVAARPLLDARRWSRGRVRHAQLGGARDDRASVMVVVEQHLGGDGRGEERVVRTLDVRVERHGSDWRLEALVSAGGDPVTRPARILDTAAAVLEHPGIGLPDSARWDVHAGEVHPRLLAVMLELADRTSYEVVTFARGHPQYVFGTNRLSDHSLGRAVDIVALDGVPVVSGRQVGSPTYTVVQWLWAHPDVRQVGSPWALDGYGGRSFTDLVHQDHLHVAVFEGEMVAPSDG